MPETKIASNEKIKAKIEEPIIIFLRSYLSERDPIGHWKSAPESITPTNNNEVSKIVNFIVIAYTDNKLNIGANMKPVQNIETLPNGEILKSSLILIELVFLNFGGLRFVRSIGINAIENNKDIKIKGSYCSGLLTFNKKFPKAIPK